MRSIVLIVAVALIGASACSDPPRYPTQPIGRPSFSLAQAAKSAHHFDAAMARIADRVPGFGGLYIDKAGQPVAYLKDASRMSELAAVLVSELGSNAPAIANRTLRILYADFDVRELALWRVALEHQIDWSTVSFTQVAFSINRVHIGVKTQADVLPIQAAAARIGIPLAAVRISVLPVDLAPITTLSSRIRPIVGGLIVGTAPPGGTPAHSCSVGLPMKKFGSNQLYFLTAAHCGDSLGYADNIQMWQHTILSADTIGRESDDLPFTTADSNCPNSPIQYYCRYSDAALYRSSLPSDSVAFGTIAQTVNYPASGTWGTAGSDSIIGNFTIASDGPDTWLVPGQLYQKMGYSTGWTSGYILSIANGDAYDGSCTLFAYPVNAAIKGSGGGKYLLCQFVGNTYAQAGDSGSPVFFRATTSTVYFLGILWGITNQNQSVFGSFDDLQEDFGAIVTH